MTGKICYESQGEGVVITWIGSISGEGLKEVNAQLNAAAESKKLRYQIWDFTKAAGLEISSQDLRDLAMQDRAVAKANPGQIIAIVGKQEMFSGYDRIFHIYEEVWSGYRSKTFPSVADAREWVKRTMDEN